MSRLKPATHLTTVKHGAPQSHQRHSGGEGAPALTDANTEQRGNNGSELIYQDKKNNNSRSASIILADTY